MSNIKPLLSVWLLFTSYLFVNAQVQNTSCQNGCTNTFKTEVILPAAVPFNCDSLRPANLNKKNFTFQWQTPEGKVYNTLNLKPRVAGVYTFCYDTIDAPSRKNCRKSKQVTVTNALLQPFAEAGPDSLIMCVGQISELGTKGDYKKYKYLWSGNMISSFAVRNILDSSKLTVFASANFIKVRQYNKIENFLYLTVTDLKTHCSNRDSINLLLIQPPALKFTPADSTFCNKKSPEINFSCAFQYFGQYKRVGLYLDSNLQSLPAPHFSNEVYPYNYDVPFKNIPVPSTTYNFKIPQGTTGFHRLFFYVEASIGDCKSILDTTLCFNCINMVAGDRKNCTVTGNVTINSENNFNIYPNPSYDNFTLMAPASGEIEIYNAMGRLLITHIARKEESWEYGQMLPSGMYWIIYSSNNRRKIVKWVKW